MRILVVEDEPRLLRNLAKNLREEGYAVDTAEDGDDGLFKALNYDYDALVLDVMLPELDGWQVLERLRASKRTPVLMLTAREYAILEYLVLHRGEVVTRSALYEHLFDESEDTLSNLLDVHVFSIRKKLGAELIVTRRGQGYCIEH